MNGIKVLKEKSGIQQAYKESLKQPSLDIICLAEHYDVVIGDFFDTQFSPKLYGKIKTREILPDTQANRDFAAAKDSAKNAVRFIQSRQPSESDMILWENRVILISFGTQPLAILIDNQEIVSSMHQQFEFLWSKLKN